jgi:hypothetical protein
MNRERVIVTPLIIERTGQIKLFTVRIPREAQNIIGVEMGMQWLTGVVPPPSSVPGPPPGPPSWPPPAPIGGMPMIVRRNQLVGELKLQSYEKANIFYAADLMINQNIDLNDFTTPRFAPKIYTHHKVMNEDPVSVNGNTTILQGVFRNKFGITAPSQFKVFVYVWLEVKEDQSNL